MNKERSGKGKRLKSSAKFRGGFLTSVPFYRKDTLYLKDVKVENETFDLDNIFPDIKSNNKVKASWFTGIILIYPCKYKDCKNREFSAECKDFVLLKFEQGVLKKKNILTRDEYQNAVNEYFKRKETNNPVTKGPIFEFGEYVKSLKKSK